MYFNDLIIIDVESYSFTTVNVVENALPTPISNLSLTTVGNTTYVYGGTDAKGACFNDIRFVDLTQYLDERDISVGEGANSDYSFKILIIGDAGDCTFIDLSRCVYVCMCLYLCSARDFFYD
jgi:hypothetical protein